MSIQHFNGRNRVVHVNRLQPHRQRSSFKNESRRPISEYATTRYSLTGESGTSRPVSQNNTRSGTLELRKQNNVDHEEKFYGNDEDETTNTLNQSMNSSISEISKSIMENDHTNTEDHYCSPEKTLSPCLDSPEPVRDTINLRANSSQSSPRGDQNIRPQRNKRLPKHLADYHLY